MNKDLIIYFSRADENYAVGYVSKGNTEVVAEYVRELTNADMFKVIPAIPYAKDYKTCIEEAKMRIHNAPIEKKLNDVSLYDTIYIMSPIYWGTYAPEMETLLKEIDFSGKNIRVLTTHEGSGLGNVLEDVKRICVGANIIDAIAIQGSRVNMEKDKIKDWVTKK